MTWTRRQYTAQGNMAHGITFVMFESRGRAEAAIKGRKAHLDGPVSLTLALDQREYGDELIAQVFTQDPPRVAPRRDDSWNRVQVYLGKATLDTAEMLERVAAEIRERLVE